MCTFIMLYASMYINYAYIHACIWTYTHVHVCVLKQNKTTISHEADRFSEILAGYLLATFVICVVLMIVSCVVQFYR